MHTYYRSFIFWVRWVGWLVLLSIVACAGLAFHEEPVFGKIVAAIFSLAILFFLFVISKKEPYAIKLYRDRFEVCFIFARKKYFFADVARISRDFASDGKAGRVKSVRVVFHDGKYLHLKDFNNRRLVYEDLATSWRAAV